MSASNRSPDPGGEYRGNDGSLDDSSLPLSADHLTDLRKSGLSDETIRACRFESIEGNQVREVLGWKGGTDKLGPCLLIPFLDREGRNPDGFARIKPGKPRSEKRNGKVRKIKYEQPQGKRVRPYFPPMIWALLDDPTLPLWITEGEKKAAKAAQEGFACVGLTGVECWHRRDEAGGPRVLHPDLAALPLAGREVYVAFDSDLAENKNVRRAEGELTHALVVAGARVKLVRLPAGANGVKQGLDDFLVHRTADDLRRLMKQAEEPMQSTSSQARCFKIGDKVIAGDRGNIGTVVDVDGMGRYHVHFRNPDTGDEATVPFLEKNLAPLNETGGGNSGPARFHPLPPFQPFPLHTLPPIMAEMVQASAECIGCDPALVALPALSVAAGCIGNARAIMLKRGWHEPCVLWSLTVAESGGHKSPAYRAVVSPLLDLQMELFEAYQQRREESDNAAKERRKKPKDDRGEEPEEPKRPPTFVTSDTTIETLGEQLRTRPKGMLLARDELDAWFQSFTRYKGKGGGSDRSQWLELHSASALRIDRLTREGGPLAVRRAAVSVTGTIQPGILAAALDKSAMEAGLGARFLFAMPPKRRRVWSEAEVSEELEGRYQRLLQGLLDLPLADDKKRKPHFLGLSPAAKQLWLEFFTEWSGVQFAAEGAQASAFAKIEGYAPRLMLLHHVVAHVAAGADDCRPVTEASARAGIELARWFAAEMVRIYAMLRESTEERETRKLVEWIRQHGGRVTVRQLQKSNSLKWRSSDEAEAALEALVKANLGRWEEEPPKRGGHTKKWFRLSSPTPDTSDTRPPEEPQSSEAPSDTRSDTCPQSDPATGPNHATNPFRGFACGGGDGVARNRASEVSDVGDESPQVPESSPEQEVCGRVSEASVGNQESGEEILDL